MADKKISALTAATTPLAGTEVLPIVQSGATVKVSVDNLTTGKTVPVGSLSVSGSQPRITADMSNATQTNRLFFQNSVANASTSVGVMPSGSGTSSRLNLFNGSDPDNAGYLQAQISATYAVFNSAKTGTGTALPYIWQIGSVTYMGLGTTGDLTVSSGNLVQGTAAKGITTGGSFALGLGANGSTTAAQVFPSGGVSIGNTTDPGATNLSVTGSISATNVITAKATTTNGSTYAMQMTNSANTDLMSARSDGLITTGTAANSPYNLTTGSAANVYVDNQGWLYRSTSSLKYKTDIQDAAHGLNELLALRPVTYKQKSLGPNGEVDSKVYGGLIAEEVDKAGLTEFVQYAEDKSPDALHYGNMVSLCIKAIQQQQELIVALQKQVAALTK